MAYPPKLLGDGESIAFEMRPHWRSLIVPALVLIATVAVAAFLLSTFDGSNIKLLFNQEQPSTQYSFEYYFNILFEKI